MTESPDLLDYLGQPFETTEMGGQLWFRADELGQVMGLAEPEQDVNRVHQMNWQQFSDRLTAFVGVETREGPRLMRAFNLLGAYVLSTYFLSLDAQQFRRWLLETLIFHQIDVRREIHRLIALNADLEADLSQLKRAVEADLAQLKQSFADMALASKNPAAPEPTAWLEGEFRRLHEQQQAHQADILLGLSQALRAAPPTPAAAPPAIATPAYHATRPLTQYGPVPVYLGEIGGKPCPVVSARDVAFFIGAEVSRDPVYHRLLMGDFIEELGLCEGIDFERMYYTGPIGTPIFNGLYYLSLDCAVAIARQRDNGAYEEWQRSRARQLTGYLLDCRECLADWENAQPEPLAASSLDEAGFQADPDDPLLFQSGATDSVQVKPVVTLHDGKAVTTSLEVARYFGKQHKNVLQSIESLKADLPEDFTELNFQLSEYEDSTGRKLPAYELTRDAFTLLAMGFTGKTALAFKLAYIEAFNRMELELLDTRRPLPNPGFTDRQEKIAAKAASPKASKPKAKNPAKPDPAKPANGKGQK